MPVILPRGAVILEREIGEQRTPPGSPARPQNPPMKPLADARRQHLELLPHVPRHEVSVGVVAPFEIEPVAAHRLRPPGLVLDSRVPPAVSDDPGGLAERNRLARLPPARPQRVRGDKLLLRLALTPRH